VVRAVPRRSAALDRSCPRQAVAGRRHQLRLAQAQGELAHRNPVGGTVGDYLDAGTSAQHYTELRALTGAAVCARAPMPRIPVSMQTAAVAITRSNIVIDQTP
jgi:hypothetical protein